MKGTMNEREKLVLEILYLAYLVHIRTDRCVFINFAGHVNSLGVDVRKSTDEWQEQLISTEFQVNASRKYGREDPERFLKAKRDILKKILEDDGEIPFDECDVVERIVEEYYF